VLTNDCWATWNEANFICEYDRAGNFMWARTAGTNSAYPWQLRVGTDASGNAYLAGRFAGIGAFGTNTLVSATPGDLFVAKYDPQGQVLWVRQIGAYEDMPTSFYFGFAVDPDGNAFVASRDGGSANFGAVTLTNSTAFLAKYDNAGSLVWAREALGADAIALGTNDAVCLTGKPGVLAKYDNQGTLVWSKPFPLGQAIALDAQENIFTTGRGVGTYDGLTLTNSGGSPDFFAAKCDSSGQLQWLRQVGGVQRQLGTAIGLDEYNNVYVTSISGNALPEPALSFGTTVLTNVFTFVAKYDPAGNPLWARAPATTNLVRAAALAVKDSSDVFVGGFFTGTASIGTLTLSNAYPCSGSSFSDPCSLQMFVAKLDGAESAGLPIITVGPQDQAVMTGNDATFSVTVPSGIPLSYQWFYDQTNAIEGATGSSLVLGNVQPTDAGSYSVSVSNTYGSVNSEAASLTVCVAPAVTAAPQSLTLLAGQDAVFNVEATGTEPLVYQWQFNGTNLVEATDATLILTNVTTDQAGTYGVTVTNLAGIASTSATFCVYSSAAAVLTAPPSFSGDGFQFTNTGVPGFNYAVEASTNLVDWVPLVTNTSPFTFVDGDATNFPARYYRSVYLP
jgi:catechol 2,3-dioxygenase-like lactoylglutathione lyase family enzyme